MDVSLIVIYGLVAYILGSFLVQVFRLMLERRKGNAKLKNINICMDKSRKLRQLIAEQEIIINERKR